MEPLPPASDFTSFRQQLLDSCQCAYGARGLPRLEELIDHSHSLFMGNFPPYQAGDTAYHDLEHTCQVTLCWDRMFQNLRRHYPQFPVAFTDYLLGIAACLLHDTGYLKKNYDPMGTGAKFALIHENRGCRIADEFLSTLRWPGTAIAVVQRLIAATGPRAIIEAMDYDSPTERRLAQMLATADFLAQMADPRYLDKIPALFSEMEELDKLRGLSPEERPFPNLQALVSSTPAFWHKVVLPKLKRDYANAYQLLNDPFPDGPNAYLQHAEANIRALQ